MRNRILDESHDWTFGKSQSDYVVASDAIKQGVLCAILSVRNDWFLNLGYGVDWVSYLGRTVNLASLETDLKRAILNVDGVYQVVNVDIGLERDKRHATITVEYTDIYNRKLSVRANVRN